MHSRYRGGKGVRYAHPRFTGPSTPHGIPDASRRVIRDHADLWQQFMAAADVMFADDAEATVEDLAGFVVLHRQLVNLGVAFDPAFSTHVEALVTMLAGRPDIEADVEDGHDAETDRPATPFQEDRAVFVLSALDRAAMSDGAWGFTYDARLGCRYEFPGGFLHGIALEGVEHE